MWGKKDILSPVHSLISSNFPPALNYLLLREVTKKTQFLHFKMVILMQGHQVGFNSLSSFGNAPEWSELSALGPRKP